MGSWVRDLNPLSWGEYRKGVKISEEKAAYSLQSRGLETSRFLQEAQNQQGKAVALKVPVRVYGVAECPFQIRVHMQPQNGT